jgi:hypothetical protein
MENKLSKSHVSLKLEEIKKRCHDLLEEPDGLADLTLEEPDKALSSNDPYNHVDLKTRGVARTR